VTSTSPRKSADERREELVEIATRHFAESGFRGTSTEAIARDAGISQPYLFRLFRTKKDLFLACSARMTERIKATFAAAAEGLPREERLAAMGQAYVELLQDRTLLRMQVQAHAAAAADEDLRSSARSQYVSVMESVQRLTGATGEELMRFMAAGMLLNVMAALDLEGIDDGEAFAARWCDPAALMAPSE
jgi:AcrR family transcriptional regulator